MLTIAIVSVLALLVFTRLQVRRIERLHPPSGEMVDAGGFRLHAVHIKGPPQADLPPIVFLHGASGNLCDQVMAFRRKLEGRADLLFVDRPGHGWSERGGADNGYPPGQARSIAALLDSKGIDRALVVGHSFGGAIASSFALENPQRVAGLLLMSAPTHPWPGGIAWHLRVSSAPVIGHIFTELLAVPAGLARIARAARCVFRPNAFPPDYLERTGTALVLRPRSFRNNAVDVANLFDHVVRTAPRYGDIKAPTVVITGDTDTIVSPDIHSVAMAEQVAGSQLVRIRGVGHKPDYAATDLCIAAMEHLAGMDVDLVAMTEAVERRLTEQSAHPPAERGGAGRPNQIPVIPSDPI